MVILILFFIILFNIAYLKFFYKENIIFLKYITFFLIYTVLLTYLIKFFFNSSLDENYIQSLVIIYFLLFCSSLLTINLKSLYSPSDYIFEFIYKKSFVRFVSVINFLKKKKIIKKRLIDLNKQKLILKNGNNIQLTKFGFFFVVYFILLKVFYNLKNEG